MVVALGVLLSKQVTESDLSSASLDGSLEEASSTAVM